MISGVQLGRDKRAPSHVELIASSKSGGIIEIWMDDLKTGKLITRIPVTATGAQINLKAFKKVVKNLSGHHDLFIKFPSGKPNDIYIQSLQFSAGK